MKMMAIGALVVPLLIGAQVAYATDFTDPCHCPDCGGTDRWTEKTDTAAAPANPTPVKPSDLIGWAGPGGDLKPTGPGEERGPLEEKWYALTGIVMAVKVEKDGDVHLKLADVGTDPNKKPLRHTKPAKGKKATPVKVLYIDAEIPPVNTGIQEYDARTKSAPWCSFRQTAFSWTTQIFPFTTSGSDLKLTAHPIITIVGKAFFDIDHAKKPYTKNTRPADPEVDGWEIHPIMAMTVAPPSNGSH